MKRVAVMTDSNSGITQEQAAELGVHVIPMPFYINGEVFYEGITLTQEEFYKKLSEDAEISTSQPSPGEVMAMWEDLLKEYDEIVHIPMSSGLSSACETAAMLAQDYDGRVQVVNNQRISVTQRQSVLDAKLLADVGRSAEEIKNILEECKMESSIYITLETLKYLKKGGRITPAAAAIGTLLNLKPVLQIQGEKLDAFAKARGKKQAKKTMLEAMKHDFENRFADASGPEGMLLQAAYTAEPEEVAQWEAELREAFPGYELHIDPLSLSVACHIGPGALAVACTRKLKV